MIDVSMGMHYLSERGLIHRVCIIIIILCIGVSRVSEPKTGNWQSFQPKLNAICYQISVISVFLCDNLLNMYISDIA